MPTPPERMGILITEGSMKPLILSMLIVGSLAAWVANAEAQTFVRVDFHRDINQAERYAYNQRHEGNRRDWNGRGGDGQHTGWNNSTRWVDRTQAQQREALERGLRSGRITPSEFRQLSAEQRAIRQEERVYRSDGRLSGAERTDLRQDLQTAWRNIRTEMGDGERQYYYGR